MDLQALVDEITELVVRQLGLVSHGAGFVRAGAPLILVVMGDGERGGDLVSAPIRAALAAGARVAVVPSASWPRARVEHLATLDGAVQVLDAPPTWGTLVADARAVVVPNLSLNELAAVCALLGLTPAAGAAIAALVEGRPVVAGSDDISVLTVNAARLPRAIGDQVRAYVGKVADMGVKLVEAQRLADEVLLANAPTPTSAAASPRGRNVLTRDDVEVMLRGGAGAIEVAGGTIVTPLAREVAQAAGVEIVVR